jgi:hypothetical protein
LGRYDIQHFDEHAYLYPDLHNEILLITTLYSQMITPGIQQGITVTSKCSTRLRNLSFLDIQVPNGEQKHHTHWMQLKFLLFEVPILSFLEFQHLLRVPELSSSQANKRHPFALFLAISWQSIHNFFHSTRPSTLMACIAENRRFLTLSWRSKDTVKMKVAVGRSAIGG